MNTHIHNNTDVLTMSHEAILTMLTTPAIAPPSFSVPKTGPKSIIYFQLHFPSSDLIKRIRRKALPIPVALSLVEVCCMVI